MPSAAALWDRWRRRVLFRPAAVAPLQWSKLRRYGPQRGPPSYAWRTDRGHSLRVFDHGVEVAQIETDPASQAHCGKPAARDEAVDGVAAAESQINRGLMH